MLNKNKNSYIEISDIIESKGLNSEKTLLYFKPKIDIKNFYIFICSVFFIAIVCFIYIVYVISSKSDLRESYYKNLFTYQELPATRGLIFSSDMKLLAGNEPSFIFYIERADYDKVTDKNNLKEKIKENLNINEDDLGKKLTEFKTKSKIVLKETPRLESLSILPKITYSKDFPIKTLQTFKRKYTQDYEFSNVLGYVKRNGLSYDGLIGIEKYYDDILKGEAGYNKYLKDSVGNQIKQIEIKNPIKSQNLILTLNYKYQMKLYEIMSNMLKDKKLSNGALVMTDTRTGQILATLSIPSFNQNQMSGVLTEKDLKEIFDNTSFINRAFSGLYSPGSIFKIVTALGALNENIVDPYMKIRAPSYLQLPSKYDKNKQFIFRDWKDHGYLNMIEAITFSSNTYFYKLTSGFFEDLKGLGIQKLIEYAKNTVFDKTIGIDLPSEKEGNMPEARNLRPGDVLHTAIGQGQVLTTLVQINALTNIIANGGYYFKPYLLKKIVSPNTKNTNEIASQKITFDFRKEAFELVKEGMCQAVENGTARRIKEVTPNACAKTGTSQVGGQKNNNSLFTIFYPKENPDFSITIIVEGGGEGSDSALTIAKEFLKFYISSKNEVANKKNSAGKIL